MIVWLSVFTGIVFSALAQLLIKQASDFEALSLKWNIYAIGSAGSYFISFVLYFYIMKNFNLSRIAPLMTCGVVLLVVLLGWGLRGETMGWIHWMGVVLACSAVVCLGT
jgi:drug/metabolite transporter (DMT)-like permease